MNRRRFLHMLAWTTAPVLTGCVTRGNTGSATERAAAEFKIIEQAFGGRIGVYAINTANDDTLDYRADERFSFCSTFKVMAAAGLLHRVEQEPGLLGQRVTFPANELVEYSPVTEKHIEDGMTLAELCAAAIQYSDNTAANLMIKTLGGPASVTAYARTLGDRMFRLDRWETALNESIPGDPRDTTTPAAMASSLQRLVLGDALPEAQRDQLKTWLCGNTTGAARIKAGIPADWAIGDKTGSGRYGVANDIAVVWPPQHPPIVMAIYTTQPHPDAKPRNDILASIAKVIADWVNAGG